ncbi:MAG TPA: hypothetical protein PLQ00_07905, partial [Thermoguttaceae bacterium]|nr:hypothetical protein [Thermoguttaceae bacterium]
FALGDLAVAVTIELREDIHRLLRQGMEERSVFEEAQKSLLELADRAEQMRQGKKSAGGGGPAPAASGGRPAQQRPAAPSPS